MQAGDSVVRRAYVVIVRPQAVVAVVVRPRDQRDRRLRRNGRTRYPQSEVELLLLSRGVAGRIVHDQPVRRSDGCPGLEVLCRTARWQAYDLHRAADRVRMLAQVLASCEDLSLH